MKKVILKNGKELVIRKAIIQDVEKIIQYKIIVGGESDYLTFGEDEVVINIDNEKLSIESINKRNNSILAVALIDGEIVGSIVFRGGERSRVRHVGEMGVTVRKSYWGLGIGSILLDFLIKWAKETDTVKKINLRVRVDNEGAIKLYKKYGFKKEGILTRDFYIDGRFYDSMNMGLIID
ncbi:GNAT family N-acetyltransferase [Alkaliphilus sp. B6464]|uniref:GNAT family N-acetyltransferase n=1 Tax=Alkaliphilus sp. B6464 TaxID=2731219 RepID=UPI001BA7A154|nr:GNAT family protein [Alkaliphilus sp. B6464]QUH19493.1 GNAT family N-acetyltransferase [Alkaliphilus sp. B6464]